MAIVIRGDRQVFDQMLSGGQSPQLREYVSQTNQYFQNALTQVGAQFVSHAQQVFARMSSDEAASIARRAMALVNIHLQQDIIYTPTTIEELQEAPNTMVRWIMAYPELRQRYFENTIDAYGDRYIDTQPDNSIGWTHHDYQEIYSGWLEPVYKETKDEEGNATGEWFDEHTEVLFETNYRELLDEEAAMIMSAHALVARALLKEKRDPTSYYDNVVE